MPKMVCRVFDADGVMLGWAAHEARLRGDAMVRASGPAEVAIERDGIVSAVSWHWTELNVETRVPAPAAPLMMVRAGSVIVVAQHDDPLMQCGAMPQGLPAVTIRQPVAIGVPVGQMGAVPAGQMQVSG